MHVKQDNILFNMLLQQLGCYTKQFLMQLLQYLVSNLPLCAIKTMAVNDFAGKILLKLMLLILESLEESEPEERQGDVWTRTWIKRREERGRFTTLYKSWRLRIT